MILINFIWFSRLTHEFWMRMKVFGHRLVWRAKATGLTKVVKCHSSSFGRLIGSQPQNAFPGVEKTECGLMMVDWIVLLGPEKRTHFATKHYHNMFCFLWKSMSTFSHFWWQCHIYADNASTIQPVRMIESQFVFVIVASTWNTCQIEMWCRTINELCGFLGDAERRKKKLFSNWRNLPWGDSSLEQFRGDESLLGWNFWLLDC